MRKYIFLTALIICSKTTFAQVKISDMPTFTGNLNGGWFPMVISGTNRKFPGDSIVRRSELNAYLTSITGAQVTSALGYTPLNETDLYPYVTSGTAATLYTPKTRTITINGETYDLSDNRSWTVSTLPSQTGNSGKYLTTNGTTASWGTVPDSYLSSSWYSTTNNSSNWNTAYGWGNHASAGYLTSSTAATTYASLSGSYSNPSWITSLGWSKISSTPTTLSGYGITDATSNARSALSLTTSGTGGASTYNSSTGVLNIPNYISVDYSADNVWLGLNYYRKDGIGTTQTEAIRLENTTAATSGGAQYSPYLNFSGKWYNTTSLTSNTFGVRMYANSVNSPNSNPGGYLNFQTSPDGVTWTDRMAIYQNGFVRFNSAIETNNINTYSGNLLTVSGGIYSTNASQTNGFVSGVYVGGNPGNIATSALLHVNSTTKGSIPFPKMTTSQRTSISSPTSGLGVYDTDLNSDFVYNGSAWVMKPNEGSSPTWTGSHTFKQSSTGWNIRDYLTNIPALYVSSNTTSGSAKFVLAASSSATYINSNGSGGLYLGYDGSSYAQFSSSGFNLGANTLVSSSYGNSFTSTSTCQFEVQSTTKGVLIPRMTKAQRNAISSPADGLMVMVTGESGGTYFSVYNLNQTRWEKMTTTAD